MKIEYDKEVDALYILLTDAKPVDTMDVEDGVTIDLDDQGHIVTNNHVIQDADRVRVNFQNGESVEAEVVDVRTLRPLDMETVVESVKKTNRAIVVEESWRTGGFGAEVVALVVEEALGMIASKAESIDGNNPNARGNALYALCKKHVDREEKAS